MSSCDIGRRRDIIYELLSRVVSVAKLRVLFGCIRAWGSSVACNRVPRSMPLDGAHTTLKPGIAVGSKHNGGRLAILALLPRRLQCWSL
jgi:hypothetical protein